jgi:DNA-binding transcriptional LysR family regulator
LQDDYGAVFIKRKSRGIELTPAGIEFHRDVTLILDKLKGLRKKFAGAAAR